MKCHPARWLWGLIPIAMLSWIAVHVEADLIERDLEERSAAALAAAGYDWASVAFSGRDGLLVGRPVREDERARALALVGGVRGVHAAQARAAVPAHELLAIPALPVEQPEAAPLPDLTPSEASSGAVSELRPAAVALLRAYVVDTTTETGAAQGNSPPTAVGAQPTAPALLETPIATAALPESHTVARAGCVAAVETAGRSVELHFARGKAGLDASDKALLDRLVAAVNVCPQARLRIAGHADAAGRAGRNLTLSQRRARSVASYLTNKGIDAGRLEAVGYGETRPVAPNDSRTNRAKNRRIEVVTTERGTNPPGHSSAGR